MAKRREQRQANMWPEVEMKVFADSFAANSSAVTLGRNLSGSGLEKMRGGGLHAQNQETLQHLENRLDLLNRKFRL